MKHLVLASVFLNLQGALTFPYIRQYGDLCDWRSPTETCDQTRGLSCSYATAACSCWDARRLYSSKLNRCVGKAGEECAFFETERLCTDNAYCVEDRSLSPIPICVCLKGYFRSDNGTCIKYSKLGEYCQPFPSRQACEAESGLKCIDYTCHCEPGQVFDPIKEMCLSKAGRTCSRTLNNCIKNSECNEKMWAFDYETGETKVTGYRCGCKAGLKITDDGLCSVDYGGGCNKTSDCFVGENLSCLNGICQCHPLSQIYDKNARRCFNLVGTRCHLPGEKNKKNPTGISNLKSEEGSFSTESADCIANSKCVSSDQNNFYCNCTNGSSETNMKTCLQGYGQSCQTQIQDKGKGMQMAGLQGICNIEDGLICHSDTNLCKCADPSLIYEKETKSCVARLRQRCGMMPMMSMLNVDEDFKTMIYIKCVKNLTCLEKGINPINPINGICVPKENSSGTSGSSLSKIMFNNAQANNIIVDKM